MIHHLHSTLASGTGPTSTATRSQSTLESFLGALSDATASANSASRSSGPPNGGYDPFL